MLHVGLPLSAVHLEKDVLLHHYVYKDRNLKMMFVITTSNVLVAVVMVVGVVLPVLRNAVLHLIVIADAVFRASVKKLPHAFKVVMLEICVRYPLSVLTAFANTVFAHKLRHRSHNQE